jgi:hypothetical protein
MLDMCVASLSTRANIAHPHPGAKHTRRPASQSRIGRHCRTRGAWTVIRWSSRILPRFGRGRPSRAGLTSGNAGSRPARPDRRNRGRPAVVPQFFSPLPGLRPVSRYRRVGSVFRRRPHEPAWGQSAHAALPAPDEMPKPGATRRPAPNRWHPTRVPLLLGTRSTGARLVLRRVAGPARQPGVRPRPPRADPPVDPPLSASGRTFPEGS